MSVPDRLTAIQAATLVEASEAFVRGARDYIDHVLSLKASDAGREHFKSVARILNEACDQLSEIPALVAELAGVRAELATARLERRGLLHIAHSLLSLIWGIDEDDPDANAQIQAAAEVWEKEIISAARGQGFSEHMSASLAVVDG